VPQEIRKAMGAAPRQRLAWEAQKDGSAVVRLVPSVMELAGSLKSNVPFTTIREETDAATDAWVTESLKPKRR